jgi:hypothetical protein
MDPTVSAKNDSERSDEEKVAVSQDEEHNGILYSGDMPADPDAHLTAAEKAAVDRKLLWRLDYKLIPWVSCPPQPYMSSHAEVLALHTLPTRLP